MSFSLLTFNVHSFNNGADYLASAISDYTVPCVQEHWLYEWDFPSLYDRFPGYKCAAISIMSTEDVSKPGRPYGGLAIYYYASADFNVEVLCHSCDNRVLAVKLKLKGQDIIIFNVYFHALSTSVEYFDQIALICGFIDSVIQDNYNNVIILNNTINNVIAGDFNCNSNSFINNNALLILIVLYTAYDLKLNDDYYSGKIDYTFKCASRNVFTWIDNIFVSKPLLDKMLKVSVVDSGNNLSNHCILGFHFLLPIRCNSTNQVMSETTFF
jgi:exonuclease III